MEFNFEEYATGLVIPSFHFLVKYFLLICLFLVSVGPSGWAQCSIVFWLVLVPPCRSSFDDM